MMTNENINIIVTMTNKNVMILKTTTSRQYTTTKNQDQPAPGNMPPAIRRPKHTKQKAPAGKKNTKHI